MNRKYKRINTSAFIRINQILLYEKLLNLSLLTVTRF